MSTSGLVKGAGRKWPYSGKGWQTQEPGSQRHRQQSQITTTTAWNLIGSDKNGTQLSRPPGPGNLTLTTVQAGELQREAFYNPAALLSHKTLPGKARRVPWDPPSRPGTENKQKDMMPKSRKSK